MLARWVRSGATWERCDSRQNLNNPDVYPLDDVRGPRRPNRGVTQRLKGGVAAGMVVMDVLIAATQNSANYTIMEIVVESGALSAPFGPPERCAWTLDGLRSWLSSCASLAARALPSPGHKAARPGGAGSSPLDGSPHWCCQPVGGTTQAIGRCGNGWWKCGVCKLWGDGSSASSIPGPAT